MNSNESKMDDLAKTSQKCSEGNIATSEHNSKSRARAFCFTSFNLTEPVQMDCMRYLCYSPEICPTTQKPHWQGFFYLYDQKTMSAACKVFKEYKVSVQFARGDPEENRIYCGAGRYEKNDKIKEANPNFKEFGTIPAQGKRVDLDAVKEEILNGKKVDDICIERPILFHQYGRTLERIEEIVNRKKFRDWMTEGEWLYGDTGVGKSKRAFKNYNPDTHYVLNINDGGFWNGYTGQEVVIIQEFRGQICYGELLDLIDRYPKTVKVKGKAPVPFLAKKVIITSPVHPIEVYHNLAEKDSLEQLKRRVNIIELVKENTDNKGIKKCLK